MVNVSRDRTGRGEVGRCWAWMRRLLVWRLRDRDIRPDELGGRVVWRDRGWKRRGLRLERLGELSGARDGRDTERRRVGRCSGGREEASAMGVPMGATNSPTLAIAPTIKCLNGRLSDSLNDRFSA
ncbi:MAG: hypothetical protein AAGF75_09565 [Cyanobacteria bacterium P01_H01_bin.130]